MCYANTFTK